ncbi:MAG: zinc-binding dehydrogenase [Thermomicrobiales bacterium]|jgi:2-desacetyl-2-hydroxyethyl bacteriochlorophyllide A dehydrogenase|nr:zinc-binding dehydrogenase [Thermomicrobiales bacterium]
MTTTRAAVYLGPMQLELREIELPAVGADDVMITVRACGICGSDIHGLRAGLWVEPGEVMGHEWAGDVIAVGENVQHLSVGDRITVGQGSGGLGAGWEKSPGYGLPGAYAEVMHVPSVSTPRAVATIPEGISYEEAAAMEPLRCGLHAARLADVRSGDWVAVIGCGAIGLCTMQAIKATADCRMIAIDISERRLKLARELGADVVIDAGSEDVLARVADLTGAGHYRWGSQAAGKYGLGAKVDVVVEAAGIGLTLRQALEMVKWGGTVIQIALYENEVLIDPTIITQKQIRLQGSAGFGLAPFEDAAALVLDGSVRLEPIITHRSSLDDIAEAFAISMDGSAAGKIVVVPAEV